ncbi:MAG: hypothetical protein QOE86_1133 [Solirubrobacteraceae bacterium]|nr:hypothetical protein [Solirubrobacteraceae bacterium]
MRPVWHALTEPWRSGIGVRALLELGLLGISGGALGCWIVLYGLSYSAESFAHAMLPGLVVSSLVGIPLGLGGGAALLAAAAATAGAARTPVIGRDAAVAIVVTGFSGLGALLALSPATPARLGDLLFGDVLGVSNGDLAAACALALAALTVLPLVHRRLLVVAFDRSSARSLGVAPARTDALLLGMLALALLVAVQGLGTLLVVAILVAPAATARLVTRRLPTMMAVGVLVAVGSGTAGLYLSYYAGTAAGASIAGVLVLVHLAVLIVSRTLGRA